MKLTTRGGYDWTKRYPWIVEAALKNRIKQFVIDGEAVVLGVDGISDFNALHSRKHDEEVQLYAFDMLAIDGDDLRPLPLSMRKAHLARLLARRPDGIFLNSFEQGEMGPDLFRKACKIGLEGLVSKRFDRPYRGGRSSDWVKVKNRKHHVFTRVIEAISQGVYSLDRGTPFDVRYALRAARKRTSRDFRVGANCGPKVRCHQYWSVYSRSVSRTILVQPQPLIGLRQDGLFQLGDPRRINILFLRRTMR